jgi:hypothetical protein
MRFRRPALLGSAKGEANALGSCPLYVPIEKLFQGRNKQEVAHA